MLILVLKIFVIAQKNRDLVKIGHEQQQKRGQLDRKAIQQAQKRISSNWPPVTSFPIQLAYCISRGQ